MADPSDLVVSRCICADISFGDLLRLHRELGLTLDQIADRTDATRGCTMCLPYVIRTLQTGQIAHPLGPPPGADPP